MEGLLGKELISSRWDEIERHSCCIQKDRNWTGQGERGEFGGWGRLSASPILSNFCPNVQGRGRGGEGGQVSSAIRKLPSDILHCIALYCIILHCLTLYYTVLHYIALY